jgi:hypothetical protein
VRERLERTKKIYARDLAAARYGRVPLPYALSRKYTNTSGDHNDLYSCPEPWWPGVASPADSL